MADEPTLAALLRQGGIGSDALLPVARVERDPVLERQIQRRAMAGLEPTPDMAAYLRAMAPEKEAQGERLANVGAELSMIPQALRAGSAIGEAARDPTLPNITNAGVQSAFTVLRPIAAAKMLGAGYAGAIADQLGLLDTSAEAQTRKQQAAPKQLLPGLDASQQAALDAAEKKLLAEDYEGPAGRKQLVDTVNGLRAISADYQREKNRLKLGAENADELAKQAEYNRQVEESEATFKHEMARDRRFSETPVGKMYDKTGGYAPFLAGTVAGTIARAGSGPTSVMTKHVIPTIAGGVAGFIAPNAPAYYNSTHTEADNPKKRAYEARGEALPPGHPRKQEFLDYAKTLPEQNPVQKAALEQATLSNILKRGIFGAGEGALAGFGGSDVVNAVGRSGSATGRFFSPMAAYLRSLGGRGDRRSAAATTGSPDAGILSEARSPSARPTSGEMSSDPILPGSATGRSPMAAMLRDAPERPRLAERIGAPDPVPQLSAPSSLPASETPNVLIRTTDSRGIVQHRNLEGKYASGPQKGEKTKVVRKGRPEEAAPEKPGVQVDDTKPLRYED